MKIVSTFMVKGEKYIIAKNSKAAHIMPEKQFWNMMHKKRKCIRESKSVA